MEILVNAFGELSDNEWKATEKKELNFYKDKFESYPGGYIPAEIEIKNIGRGADWDVVSLIILPSVSIIFFAIPSAHKKIREAIDEWKKIFNEFQRLIKWLSFKSEVFFPDEYLFLCALVKLDESVDASELIFKDYHLIPNDNPDMKGKEDLIFNFINGSTLESAAISRQGKPLWHHTTELKDKNI